MFSETELGRIITGRTAGHAWPYNQDDEREIDRHLRRVVAELGRSATLLAEADAEHYGSGYASYLSVFCSKKGGASTQKRADADWIFGVQIYLSRLVPVAVYGSETRTRHATGGSHGFLELSNLYQWPEGDWAEQKYELETKLRQLGYTLPAKAELAELLPFEAQIPTILAGPPYRLFDALFYWED